jgi:ribosomal protein S18 acetylase RimI-like enzyme
VPTLADRAHRNLCDFYRWLPGLYSGRILDADGIVAVTAALDWPVNRTAVRTGGPDATAWEMVCETRLETRADPTGFRVRLAESAADVAGYASVAGEAFAHLAIPAEWLEATLSNPDALLADNIAIAIAEADDGPIVAGALSIVLGDEPNGYVSWVACADAARGHGLGDAVTRRVTNEGFDRGARLLTLEASPFGRNTYHRMGYRELYDYRLLIKV